eukprot:TRINITY_DN47078_c0_g1_i1.p1 TRINITY_DN47078_c0_g1~~TRINITY_DN47078_c0_g1_i1.p1  ORF type:complete len:1409 (+),score=234.55 TRINITY_DN47078_c0_g1_i1:97-4323(+)
MLDGGTSEQLLLHEKVILALRGQPEEQLVDYRKLLEILEYWGREKDAAEIAGLLRDGGVRHLCASFLECEAKYRESRLKQSVGASAREAHIAGEGPPASSAALESAQHPCKGAAPASNSKPRELTPGGGKFGKRRSMWLSRWLAPRWPWMLLSLVLSCVLGWQNAHHPVDCVESTAFPMEEATPLQTALVRTAHDLKSASSLQQTLFALSFPAATASSEPVTASPPPKPQQLPSDIAGRRTSDNPSRRLEPAAETSPHQAVDTSGDNSTDRQGSYAEEHEGHPHDALFFLFSCLAIGTLVLHSTMLPMLAQLQQTVTLFVLGILYAVVIERAKTEVELGIISSAYDMWMQIDPHLLLFTMLPVLLTGDAMTMDTRVARRVARRCVMLAGPGVLIGSFATAGFLWLYIPYDWPFLLCLVTGSILAATDPVAVVSLLKELGASPVLTVSIQGESLLNDGTAIVLYMLSFDMLKGVEYEPSDIIIFLVKTALCALGLGTVMGWVFLMWIRAASDRLNRSSAIIQCALTLCCAYWSFILAEGVLKISGVLCTVASALVLADQMWPSITDKGTMMQIWHMFEYLGNTIIFFLAGSLTGKTMYSIPAVDYFHLLVIYVMSQLIRIGIIYCFRPVLNLLTSTSEPVTKADAIVMAWGGLRGAVGLSLAIQVSMDRGEWNRNREGDRVLFYVCGVAALTLCINAPTCPALVKRLGITAPPKSRQRLLYRLHNRLQHLADTSQSAPGVQRAVKTILAEAQVQIDKLVPASDEEKDAPRLDSQGGGDAPDAGTHAITHVFSFQPTAVIPPAEEVLAKLAEARQEYERISQRSRLPLDLPGLPFADTGSSHAAALIRKRKPDSMMLQCMNETFLSLVRSQYWRQIEEGDFITGGTKDTETLLNSINSAFARSSTCVADYEYLKRQLKTGTEEFSRQTSPESNSSQFSQKDESLKTEWHKWFSSSIPFNMTMASAILLNAIFIIVGELYNTEHNSHPAWLSIEVIFNALFLLEFIFKVSVLKRSYFWDAWNIFDFSLVILGLTGLVLEIMALINSSSTTADVSTEARLLRFNRVFRVLRVCRVIRLARFTNVLLMSLAQQDFNEQLAENMRTVTVLRAFIQAHVTAQEQLLKYLSVDGQASTSEEARCILQSQTACYQAACLAFVEASKLGESLLETINLLRKNIDATQELRFFLQEACQSGLISEKESETIMGPLQSHVRGFFSELRRSRSGLRLSTITLPEDGSSSEAAQDACNANSRCAEPTNKENVLTCVTIEAKEYSEKLCKSTAECSEGAQAAAAISTMSSSSENAVADENSCGQILWEGDSLARAPRLSADLRLLPNKPCPTNRLLAAMPAVPTLAGQETSGATIPGEGISPRMKPRMLPTQGERTLSKESYVLEESSVSVRVEVNVHTRTGL